MDASYLTTQVATIIAQLHGLFDEIGVPNHERESREAELFSALSETLHNQLRQVTAEKNEMTEEAYRIIKTIRQMEASLEDNKPRDDYPMEDPELKVTAPLTRCLKGLKEKHNEIAKIHRERFEEVKKLVVALESYSSHLEPSFVKITLPPSSNSASIPPTFDLSPSYVTALDNEFTRVYEEYTRRVSSVKAIAEEVVNLWADLGTPQAQTEASIVKHYRESPEQLGLHESDISRLTTRRDKLLDEKRNREKRVKELKAGVEALWDRLGVEDMDRKRFLAGTRGCGLRVINEFEAELYRLNELKKQNLHLFVEDARYKLQELWDTLYFSEEEMLEFTPAFSDVYSDALLSAHENEISRLEALKEQRLPILELTEKHRSLMKDREDLAASSQDSSRLMMKGAKGEKRDPTRLLREEKMRKRITKELPKVEAELRKTLERWENEYGRPFLVHGERYLDEIPDAPTKVPPPRPKTPSAPPPTQKSLGRAAGKAIAPAASRQGSVMSTTRGPPPPRTATKTPVPPSTIRGNPLSKSMTANTAKQMSPSKVPVRAPLSTMKSGNNSPERRQPPPQAPSYDTSTIRKMGPPPRAPPPKMRDLFNPPNPTPIQEPDNENWRCPSSASDSSGPIHQVDPEDVYDDRARMSQMSYVQPNFAASMASMRNTPQTYRDLQQQSTYDPRYQPHQYVPHADSRVISTTSTTSQAPSGSENWETYDDASEPEMDATDAYYAKLKANKGKRMTPEGGYASPRAGVQGKKMRSVYEATAQVQTFVEENGRMVPAMGAGSDAGWTDEDAF